MKEREWEKPNTSPKENMSENSPPRHPPIDLPVKVGIAVAVVVVVLAVVGFLLYWFVLRKSASNNQGTTLFGTISVTDSTTQAQPRSFATGDTLQLKYTPSVTGFVGRSVWSLSTDGGNTFAVAISDPSYGNAVQWTIPATVFTQRAVFKVADAQNADDFVTTSLTSPFAITPEFTLTTGPGVKGQGTSVFAGGEVTCTLSVDTALKGLSTSGLLIQLTHDPQFQTGLVEADLIAGTLDTTTQTLTVTWVPTSVLTAVYYRVITTTLIANGYDSELAAVASDTISVVDNASCPTTATSDTPAFELCQLTLADATTGSINNFAPLSLVKLYLAYQGTFAGTPSMSYTLSGGAPVAWPITQVSSNTANPRVFTATLPDATTTQFVAIATNTSQTVTSTPHSIGSSFTVQVTPGSSFNVYPVCSSISYVLTVCTLFPATFRPTQWRVGFSNLDGTDVNLYDVMSVSYADHTATLKWCLNWNNLFQSTPVGQINTKRLVVAADLVYQSVPAIFNVVAYYPIFTLLSNDLGMGFSGCNNTWVFNGPFNFTAGLWPDPNNPLSDNFYISSTPGSFDHAVWIGANIEQGQNISGYAPNAPNPVNFPDCVISTGLGSIPATAGLYTVTASAQKSGAINFTSVITSQVLYTAAFDGLFYGLYAYDQGQAANAASDFTWPNQILPF